MFLLLTPAPNQFFLSEIIRHNHSVTNKHCMHTIHPLLTGPGKRAFTRANISTDDNTTQTNNPACFGASLSLTFPTAGGLKHSVLWDCASCTSHSSIILPPRLVFQSLFFFSLLYWFAHNAPLLSSHLLAASHFLQFP